MAIAPLQIPQSAQAFSGGIDFSPLANLGNLYKQAQADALKQQTLAQLGQGGAADANALLRSGDMSLAQLGIALRNRQEDLARQTAQDARSAANDKFSHDLQLKQLALSERAANRADEDKYVIKEVTAPDGSTSLVRINQRGPEGPISAAGSGPSAPSNPFGGGKFNNEQGKAAGFTDRMLQSEGILRGTNGAPGVQDQGANWIQSGIDKIQTPVVPLIPDSVKNAAHSKEYQQYDQAQRDFINAQLRRESGAAISESEFANARKQYFPQPGDSDEVKQQKAANRRAAVEAMGRESGPSYRPKSVFTSDGRLVALPKIGELRNGYRFKGGDPSDESSWVKQQ